MKTNRESSYKRLKKKYNSLWETYIKLRKRTKQFGISKDDYLIGIEESLL